MKPDDLQVKRLQNVLEDEMRARGARRPNAKQIALHMLDPDLIERFEEQLAEADEERILSAIEFLSTILMVRRLEASGDVDEIESLIVKRLPAAKEEAALTAEELGAYEEDE